MTNPCLSRRKLSFNALSLTLPVYVHRLPLVMLYALRE